MLKIVKHTVTETRVYVLKVPDDIEDEVIEDRFMSYMAFVKDPHDVTDCESKVEIEDPTFMQTEHFAEKAFLL
jgi:hypothetical protein